LSAWRFPLALALTLAALFAYYPVHFGGDVIEYTLDTVSAARHGTPEITLQDIERTKVLAPHWAEVYDLLGNDMKAGREKVFPAFVRGREAKVYPIHFFGYPMLAAVPFNALDKLRQPPFHAFVFVNLAAVFVLGLALRRFFGSDLRALAGVGLFMLCGGWLYFDWSSPECVSASLLLAGLSLFLSGAPVWGAVLAGLAGQQNPTIVCFFAFAPLLLALQYYRSGVQPREAIAAALRKRHLTALAAGACVFALPVLFNLYQYGAPNVIAKLFSDPKLVGLVRLESFFFDLNQGMILAIPAVALALLAWSWGSGREARANALELAACTLFTLALALPALAVLNWNSGASGVMRYAFWAAMPLVFALLLRLRDRARWPVPVLTAVALAQAACMWHGSSYDYVEFSPLANAVIARAPGLYHPEPEIFAERAGHNDNYIQPENVYTLRVGGKQVKTLYNVANPNAAQQLCGDGAALAPGNRYVDSMRGWRYIDGPVQCSASLGTASATSSRRP
jgi:hypothetical protein